MPYWNLHTAHAQHLLTQGKPEEFGIRDANAFLFGNYVPDIYVGYMVQHPSGILPYTHTHLADPHAIPVPREQEFWDTYVEPTLDMPRDFPIVPVPITVDEAVEILIAGGNYLAPAGKESHAAIQAALRAPDYRASDVVLGTWVHLLCDACYNEATHKWLEKYHVPAGDETRIRKQGDFELYGLTLPITLKCEPTPELIAQAAAFPQYAIAEGDARAAVEVANNIVDNNMANHIADTPNYSLFTAEFFSEIYERVNTTIETRLRAYAQHLRR